MSYTGNHLRMIQQAVQICDESLDHDLVWEALQMPGSGVVAVNRRSLLQGHMSLAGLGDRVAELIVVQAAVEAGLSIGSTNARIQAQLCNAHLANVCDQTGLTACINRNPSQRFGPLGTRTKSATVEALIAAAFSTGGLAMAERVMVNLNVI